MKMIKTGYKLLILIIVLISGFLTSCDIILRQYSGPDLIEVEIDYPANINLLSPQFGEIWNPGSEVIIKWSNTGSIVEVDIELYKKNKSVFIIHKRTQNSGELNWIIPDGIPNSVMYNIRVTNSYKSDEYGESERFAIIE